jgi:hypothetical protein
MFNLPFLLCKECYFKQMKLVEYSGRLVMEEISRQLWVLEDNYDTKIWSKRQTISIEAVQFKERNPIRLFKFLTVVVVHSCFWSLILFNVKTCCSNVYRVNVDLNSPHEIFSFQSYLKPVRFKSYWKMEQLSRVRWLFFWFVCSYLYNIFTTL